MTWMTVVTSFETRLCYSYRHTCTRVYFLWLSLVPLAFSVFSLPGSTFVRGYMYTTCTMLIAMLVESTCCSIVSVFLSANLSS